MNSERSPNSISEFVRTELILARKYLDSFRQTKAAFYRHLQATGQVVDVDSAVPCKQWLVREDPEVSPPTRLFERRLNSILTQLPLQFQKIFKRVLIIGINCHPLGTLCLRIQSVDANGELTVQMLANSLGRNPAVLLRAIVVVLPVRAWFVGLQGVGQTIYEQCKISPCHLRARFAYSFHKVLSLSQPSRHPKFSNGSPEKRRMCRPRDKVVFRNKLIELGRS